MLFRSDIIPDILCADTYGNILIYEILNANVHERRWTRRLPVANTYSLASGDFNGDGQKDFIAGGYNTNATNPDMNFWYFEGFTRSGDNSYTSMGNILFNTVQSQNSITTKDMDGDGKDEVILAISPNLYVLSYQAGKFVPIFHGDSFRNYQVSTWTDPDGISHILANAAVSPDSTVAVQWNPQLPFTGPATPANLLVKPLSEDTIIINWIATGADSYRLYRKDPNEQVSYFDIIGSNSYVDSGLHEGSKYRYAIAAIDHTYTPSESISSLWVEGIPTAPPVIEDIQLVGTHELRLLFNQSLPADALNIGRYFLSEGMGMPISANSINNHRGVQLRFRTPFPAISTDFILELRDLKGSTGVQAVITSYPFPYVPDIIAPAIEEVHVLTSKQGIILKFSEAIAPAQVNYLPNFVLTNPVSDSDNSIISAVLDDDEITISFAHKLEPSNQAYYVETNNLQDLAGNVISAQFKLARFGVFDVNDLDDVTVYPNPITSDDIQTATFVRFPADKQGSICIYNNAGNLVYKNSIGPFNPQSNNVAWRWNLKNNDGRPVSSGIYFYVIEMDGKIKRGKLAIIK